MSIFLIYIIIGLIFCVLFFECINYYADKNEMIRIIQIFFSNNPNILLTTILLIIFLYPLIIIMFIYESLNE